MQTANTMHPQSNNMNAVHPTMHTIPTTMNTGGVMNTMPATMNNGMPVHTMPATMHPSSVQTSMPGIIPNIQMRSVY